MENPTSEIARLMKQIPAEHHKTVEAIIGITFQAAQHDLELRMAEAVTARENRQFTHQSYGLTFPHRVVKQ